MIRSLLSCFVASCALAGSVFCMNQLQEIEARAKEDLRATKIVEPGKAMGEIEHMDKLLQSSVEDKGSNDEKIISCIAPICAQYREKADRVVFEIIPGVDSKHMREYQVSTSSYYRMCADAMSKLIQTLFLRMALRND